LDEITSSLLAPLRNVYNCKNWDFFRINDTRLPFYTFLTLFSLSKDLIEQARATLINFNSLFLKLPLFDVALQKKVVERLLEKPTRDVSVWKSIDTSFTCQENIQDSQNNTRYVDMCVMCEEMRL
jgi:hypothetical protein